MTQTVLSRSGGKPISVNLLKDFGKASKLYEKGRFVAAQEILERIVACCPDHSGTINNLAAIASRIGNLPKALEYALRAVKLEPTNGLFMRNVGQILFEMKQYEQAAAAFRIAAQLDPSDAKSHSVYGIALRHLERWDEATAASLRAIELDPTMADAFDNLAITLIVQRDYGRALQLFHEAIRLAPRSPSAWNNLGSCLGAIGGRTAEAVQALRNALALEPNQAASRMNLGMALLKLGDFENGWREYEARWQGSILSTVQRPASLPRWEGSPTQRTLLLHAEQGLGDTLQFCRYAPLVAARGHRVVLEVQPELLELMTDSLASEDVEVVVRSEHYPALDGLPPVDAHCPLMSVPMVMGTRLDNVPAATYLRADAGRSAWWRERLAGLGDGMRVGLVWAGSPRRDASIAVRQTDVRRSTTLATLAPLLAVPGVRFVSLQKGAGLDELRSGKFSEIYDADAELKSFADTAGLVANLDLVICVDTSISHLVGGMGKPVWMMSRYDGCFRWLEDRDDTPWYPSMRIFRQGTSRTWEPVVASLATALSQAIATRAGASAQQCSIAAG
ncbi:MAG: repeat protein [Rhodospirillales bacterium]|nr:repeat protein [Rhodospirillales bacterium]